MLSVVPLFFLKVSGASDLGSESLRGLSPPIWYSPGGASRFHAPSALTPSLSRFHSRSLQQSQVTCYSVPPLFSMSTTVPAARTGDFYRRGWFGTGKPSRSSEDVPHEAGQKIREGILFFSRLVPFFSRQMGGRTSPYCEKGKSRTSRRLNLRLPVEDK